MEYYRLEKHFVFSTLTLCFLTKTCNFVADCLRQSKRQIPISYYISVDVNETSALIFYNKGSNWPDGIPIGLSHPFDKQSAIPLL